MKLQNRWHSLVSLVMVVCLLALPVSGFGKKGKDHYDRGMKFEQAQQWEKAAQEFTLALAADPANVDYQLHFRRAVFNASQSFMQQGRALAEQREYVGAYNAFRQAFGYDPVNQLAVSEMERMLRLQEVKEGKISPTTGGETGSTSTDNVATPPSSSTGRPQEAAPTLKPEENRSVIYSGDLKAYIRMLADDLKLNVLFDRQTFLQPRTIDINLHNVTTAKALDLIFLQEGLFFQKLDRRTVIVAGQDRRQQFQQLVVRTFYLSNAKPQKVSEVISRALPASVGRPMSIVVIDEDTNSLTIRDTAENVELIGELIRSIDKDRAEVVMDVNIYEVSRTDLLQFGNQLGDDTSLVNLGGVRSSSTTLGGLSRAIVGTGATAAGLPGSFGAALVIPPSSLQALQTRNRTKLLASTQIHAFNNEESTARIGQRVPVQTAQAYPFGVQTGATTPSTSQPFGSGGFPVINYEPTGLTLSFTPQVFPNLDVQVKMKIESKDVTGVNSLTPTFTERTITGTARVQNNRTMMLASVTTDSQSQGRKGLPLLGLVPVLGRLFTSPTHDDRQVDIVIAVTPRVLRAPAVTPRDEEMRQSGTLQSPTTGSIATLLLEAARDEQIAAARQIPKEVAVQLPDVQPAYVPAAKTLVADNSGNTSTTAAQVTPPTQANTGGPQPKQSAPATSDKQDAPAPKAAALTSTADQSAPKSLDVATALKNLVSPAAGIANSSASAKQDAAVTGTVEQLSPKSEKSEVLPRNNDVGITELRLVSPAGEMRVGEKQQMAVGFKSDAPLGLAVITMRFDPSVIKIKSVSAGSIFASAKVAPTITQSIDEHGMMLVSITPAAGSSVSGDGALLNFEVEAVGAGNSALAFDLANVHLIAADGRNVTLQLEPTKLTVKQ